MSISFNTVFIYLTFKSNLNNPNFFNQDIYFKIIYIYVENDFHKSFLNLCNIIVKINYEHGNFTFNFSLKLNLLFCSDVRVIALFVFKIKTNNITT